MYFLCLCYIESIRAHSYVYDSSAIFSATGLMSVNLFSSQIL